MKTLIWPAGAFVLVCASFAFADSWGPPTLEHWSADRSHRLRVEWEIASRKPPVLIFERRVGPGLKELWRTLSPQEAAPVEVFISPGGTSVVLLDQWHHRGRGISLVFIGPGGEVLSKYTPEQVMPRADIESWRISVSSTHWTMGGILFFRAEKPQFAFISGRRTVRLFGLRDGKLETLTDAERRAVLREAMPGARMLIADVDPEMRVKGASRAALLQDTDAVSSLKRLLDDPYHYTISVQQDGTLPDASYENYLVQAAAAWALVKLIGDEATPLIEAKLPRANPYMRKSFIEAVKVCSGPRTRALLDRLGEGTTARRRPGRHN